MDVPDVRYARSRGVAIAHQVVGDGPRTLVYVPPVTNLYSLWQMPRAEAFLIRLSEEVRLIVFNPRGTGLSDRPRNITLESRMDDISAVLEANGIERATIFGSDISANACALFAATYPERCERLALFAPFARSLRSPRGEALPVVPDSVLATVLFTDLVESTERAAALGDRAWRDVLSSHHADVRRELARYRGAEVDSAGDGFFCRFDGPARAMACARAIVDRARGRELAVRAGIHTGECELIGDKIAGIAVVTSARISSLAGPGEVLVSSTVKDLVAGSGFAFQERGEHELKGVPGTWRLYAVADG